jgi:Tol biopolymer transport system component
VVVSAGTYFSLALKADGSLWSWGDNLYRQLGDGSMSDRHNPVQVGSDNDWTTVSAGKFSGLALKANGSLWAWGNNSAGQLGDGTTTTHDRPTRVPGGDEWSGVFAGAEHVLAAKTDGSLWAWGSNIYGQLGDHTKNGAGTPQPVLDFGVTTLAASAANGASGASVSEGSFGTRVADVSENGRYVAFESDASNLVPGDMNACSDVFVLTVASGAIERVSVDSSGVEANGASVYPSISEDGRLITFTSGASNLAPGDTNTLTDIFVHDRQTHATQLVSVAYDGQHQFSNWSNWSSISADGRFVAFTSDSRNMVSGDTNSTWDVFVRDLQGGTTQRVSLAYDGSQASLPCYGASISGDGRYVAFQANDPLVADDTNGVTDVFVRDLAGDTGAIQRVSVTRDGQESTGGSQAPAMSDDGRYVAFIGNTSLVPEDTNTGADVYVRGLETATLELVSAADDGSQPFGFSNHRPAISADGRYVAFTSNAALVLPDAVYTWDVFVRDRRSGVLERVSVAASGGDTDGESMACAISSDGRYVAFTSVASNLVGGDTNALRDVFIRRRW